MKNVTILWLRRDLRVKDNHALIAAAKEGTVLPIYIIDNNAPQTFKRGSASDTWLYHSLESLNKNLKNKLHVYKEDAESVFKKLIKQHTISGVFWNACFEQWNVKLSEKIKKLLAKNKIEHEEFNSSYLFHPTDILKDDGSYYKVFSAYKRKAFALKT